MTWRYFSREDRRTADALERRRRALLVQLHPDRVGSGEACSAMLAEYAQALQQFSSHRGSTARTASADGFFAQLPALLRSVGVEPEQVKAAVVERAREVVGQALEGTLKKLFNL